MKTKQNRKIGIKPIIAFVNPIENRKMRRKECMEVTCGNCGGHIIYTTNIVDTVVHE